MHKLESHPLRRVHSLFVLSIFLSVSVLFAQPGDPGREMWVAQLTSANPYIGNVTSIAVSGNNTFIGGNFDYIGPNTGSAAKLTTSSLVPNLSFPLINGDVEVIVPDGSGGWYIGGAFTKVGTASRSRAARINSDGTLHSWSPSLSVSFGVATVKAIVVASDGVYLGGNFETVNSASRSNLVKLDKADASIIAGWTGTANSTVYALALSSDENSLFVGGSFWELNGTAQQRFGKLSTANGSKQDAPNFDNHVYSIATSSGSVYVGGNFEYVTPVGGGFTSRLALCKINEAGTTVYSTFPEVNSPFGTVETIAISGNDMYVGGGFTQIGGQNLTSVAKIDLTANAGDGGVVSSGSWNANIFSSAVYDLAVVGSHLYLAGDFSLINGQDRRYAARVSLTDGSLDNTWKSHAGYRVYTIGVNGTDLYLGGGFMSFGGFPVKNIAKISNQTGTGFSDWTPIVDQPVYSIAVDGNGDVFIGGSFSNVNSTPRYNVAKINSDGTLSDWSPVAPNNTVNALLFAGGYLYAGGSFTSVDGDGTYQYIAKYDGTTGNLQNWKPGFDGAIYTLALGGDGLSLYAGGAFSAPRNRVAKITLSSGLADTWNAGITTGSNVREIAVNGGYVYIGGSFSQLSGSSRVALAKLAESDAALQSWNANISSSATITALAVTATGVYFGGTFTTVGGTGRVNIAKCAATDATLQSWYPVLSNSTYRDVNVLATSGDDVYMGGYFSLMKDLPQNSLAIFTLRALPVELTSFTASVESGNVTLQWSTATEVNNYGFEIERSADNGVSFRKIGFVQGNGNSNAPKSYSFIDAPLSGKYQYRLKQLDNDGSYTYTNTIVVDCNTSFDYALHQNYPNPFNPETVISFSLPVSSHIKLTIFNALGEAVAHLLDKPMQSGHHSVTFNATNLPAGVYFCKMQSDDFSSVKKLLLLK